MKIAYIFPGQGAQYPGMGSDFFASYSIAKHTLEEAEDVLKEKIREVILYGEAKELKETKNSQLALFIVSIALKRVVENLFPPVKLTFAAGLSLGEFSALTATHKISFAECLALVERRGFFMQKACKETSGSMSVILGLSRDVVNQAISALHLDKEIAVANYNCPGQIVISGSLNALSIAEEVLQKKGAKKVQRLQVDGAFHSPLMKQSQILFTPYIEDCKIKESASHLIMNVAGVMEKSVEKIKENLIYQVTSSVEWEKTIQTCEESEVSLYLEMGAGKTLKGFNKRIGVKGTTISIEHIEDLAILEKYLKETQ
jgi:[acyl-carrier-protein] S-malonyltransferase